MIIQCDAAPSLRFHFCLTPTGWALVAMGYDPFYRNNCASTWVRDLSARLRSEKSDYFRPVWHVSKVSKDVLLLMWENDLDMPADALTQVVTAIQSIDHECSLGLETSMKEFLCLQAIRDGSVASLSSPGVYSNLIFQPTSCSTRFSI